MEPSLPRGLLEVEWYAFWWLLLVRLVVGKPLKKFRPENFKVF
jgi:hypothetical protein